jgi:putative chitinase
VITADLLRAAVGCTPDRAELFAGPLSEACALFEINTPERLAPFLANIGHESGGFRWLSEIWGPTEAQKRYEGRKDLGNTQPGDGYLYRGRSLIQTTGRANYRELRPALLLAGYEGVPDFEADPEQLQLPRWAAASAAFFWHSRGLNELADSGNFERIVRRINGGTNGMADREARLVRAKDALAGLATTPAPSPTPARVPTPARGIPAGEIVPEEPTMAPFIAAALQAVLPAVPKLIETFGSGSEVSKRNEKAAEVVVSVAKEALGAVNEQDLAERMRTDPEAPAKVRAAVEENWFAIQEAGGGGIDGARKADLAARASGDIKHSPSFWVTLLLLPLVYLVVGSVVGLWGAAWPNDVRAAIATAVVSLIVGGAAGYYWGTTTSRNRT